MICDIDNKTHLIRTNYTFYLKKKEKTSCIMYNVYLQENVLFYAETLAIKPAI